MNLREFEKIYILVYLYYNLVHCEEQCKIIKIYILVYLYYNQQHRGAVYLFGTFIF